MELKRTTSLIITISVALAFTLAGVYQVSGCGPDVNRDGQTDVRDFEVILSGVLAQHPASPLTDVNGDGAVNILDLQGQVAGFQEPSHGKSPVNPISGKDWVAPDSSLKGICPLCHRFDDVLSSPAYASLKKLERFFSGDGWARLETARYLFNRTPHAPPSFA